jgi:hypothetical protein
MAARAAFALDCYYNFDCDQLLYCQVYGRLVEEKGSAQPTESGAWPVRAPCPIRGSRFPEAGLPSSRLLLIINFLFLNFNKLYILLLLLLYNVVY